MSLVQSGRGIRRSHEAIRSFSAVGGCFKYRVKILQLPLADLRRVRIGQRRTFRLIWGAYLREETKNPCMWNVLILLLHSGQGGERIGIGNFDVMPWWCERIGTISVCIDPRL